MKFKKRQKHKTKNPIIIHKAKEERVSNTTTTKTARRYMSFRKGMRFLNRFQDTLNKDANYCNYRPYTYLFYREVIFNLCYLYLFPHNCVQHDLPVIRYSGHLRGIRQMPLAVQKPHTYK
jgi:hypothetical protein